MSAVICEVGPRDGLQSLGQALSIDDRIALIDRLSAAGLRRIEAVSFVRDERVPQMAGAEAILGAIRRPPGLDVAALVMNARGAERALACNLQEVRYVVVASDSFSRRNQNADIATTLRIHAEIAPAVKAKGLRLSGVVAAAFGCPFEGKVPARRILDIVERLVAAGADEIVLADTIGAALPSDVEAMIATIRPAIGSLRWGCHFHNTRNMGFVNAFVALRAGAGVLDAAIGGLGGCPFAPRATGNIATEDLAFMMRGMGVATGLDLDDLIGINGWLGSRVREPLPGMLARAGPFPMAALA